MSMTPFFGQEMNRVANRFLNEEEENLGDTHHPKRSQPKSEWQISKVGI